MYIALIIFHLLFAIFMAMNTFQKVHTHTHTHTHTHPERDRVAILKDPRRAFWRLEIFLGAMG